MASILPLLTILASIFLAVSDAVAQKEESNDRQDQWEACLYASFRKHQKTASDKNASADRAFSDCAGEERQFWDDPAQAGLPRGLIARLKLEMRKDLLRIK